MPWTLYRYILKDLVRLLVVSSAVLVLVMAFAVAIRPLSEGLLGPMALVRFVLYTIPTLLGYVLPFAGAFAGTLVFARMAGDNEITACRASGMSYIMVLLPAALLGVVMWWGMLYLSNFVVPSFYRAAEQLIAPDIADAFVNQLGKERSVRFEDWIVYADDVYRLAMGLVNPAVSMKPADTFILEGVAVGMLDDQGRMQSDNTAERAEVFVYEKQDARWLYVRLLNAMRYDAHNGQLLSFDSISLPPRELQTLFKDDPRFLSFGRLHALARDPDAYDAVKQRRQDLAAAVEAELALRMFREAVDSARGGGARMIGSVPGDSYEIVAPQTHRPTHRQTRLEMLGPGQRKVTITYLENGAPVRRDSAEQAFVSVHTGGPEQRPRFVLELHRVDVSDVNIVGRGTQREAIELPSMFLNEDVTVTPPAVVVNGQPQPAPPGKVRVGQLSSAQLLAMVTAGADLWAAESLRNRAERLARLIGSLSRKIDTQLNERAASATCCLLVLMLGAVLSLRLGDRMPLVIFFWSFLLSIVAIVLTYSGSNLAEDAATVSLGIAVIWSGCALVAATVLLNLWLLARN